MCTEVGQGQLYSSKTTTWFISNQTRQNCQNNIEKLQHVCDSAWVWMSLTSSSGPSSWLVWTSSLPDPFHCVCGWGWGWQQAPIAGTRSSWHGDRLGAVLGVMAGWVGWTHWSPPTDVGLWCPTSACWLCGWSITSTWTWVGLLERFKREDLPCNWIFILLCTQSEGGRW